MTRFHTRSQNSTVWSRAAAGAGGSWRAEGACAWRGQAGAPANCVWSGAKTALLLQWELQRNAFPGTLFPLTFFSELQDNLLQIHSSLKGLRRGTQSNTEVFIEVITNKVDSQAWEVSLMARAALFIY